MSEQNPSVLDEIGPPEGSGDSPTPSDETGSEWEVRRLAMVLESVLFAAGEPLSLRQLVQVLGGASERQIEEALAVLRQEYAPGVRGIHLVEVAGGYQFRTARENAAFVQALFAEKPARLGRATLETLAIIAYKQPVTKAEIEAIRGVDVDGPLQTLLQRGLIRVAGRKETVGRPLLYATTNAFLEAFGLKSLADLPPLPEGGEAFELPSAIHAAETTGDNESKSDGQNAQHEPTNGGEPRQEDSQNNAATGTPPAGETAEDPESSGGHLPTGSGTVDPGR